VRKTQPARAPHSGKYEGADFDVGFWGSARNHLFSPFFFLIKDAHEGRNMQSLWRRLYGSAEGEEVNQIFGSGGDQSGVDDNVDKLRSGKGKDRTSASTT